MTLILPTPISTGNPDVLGFKWLNVTENDTCQAINRGAHADRCVQIKASAAAGGFGTGGHVVIEGSNDIDATAIAGGNDAPGVTGAFITLTDPLGNNLDFTAAGMKQITELPLQIRPRISAGTTVKLDIFLAMRRAR